ncbi:MAG: rhodanese-like domain-containing protein [Phycisphaerae bacterium]|jgi:rhodanese-related sulfurtransferase
MKIIKSTVAQFVILGVVSIAVGLGVNTVRAKNRIDLSRNYKSPPPPGRHEPSNPRRETSTTVDDPPPNGARLTAEDPPPAEPAPEEDYGYQVIDFAGVVEVFEDPSTAFGANLFVDARNDALYAEGHIPGALLADHWKLDEYIDTVLNYAAGAEKIIVYCKGGDCEDSQLVCGDLVEFEIEYDKVFLYPGGLDEWRQRGMPVDKGTGEGE